VPEKNLFVFYNEFFILLTIRYQEKEWSDFQSNRCFSMKMMNAISFFIPNRLNVILIFILVSITTLTMVMMQYLFDFSFIIVPAQSFPPPLKW